MRQTTSALGECPRCGEQIRRSDVLISYERGSGETRRYAECPNCVAVVRPR
jgi:ribosomal protein S27AE